MDDEIITAVYQFDRLVRQGDDELYAWMGFSEGRDSLGEITRRRVLVAGNPQHPDGPLLLGTELIDQRRVLQERLFCPRQDGPPRVGDLQPAGGALKQLHIEGCLQGRNPAARERCRDAFRPGPRGNASPLRDGDESAQERGIDLILPTAAPGPGPAWGQD